MMDRVVFTLTAMMFVCSARMTPGQPFVNYVIDDDGLTVEICLSDIESAAAAVRGGATSLELCSDRAQGGVTPSFGLLEEVVARCTFSTCY